nr:immunoglobulin light chain junction region [Macaca mulatta]
GAAWDDSLSGPVF